MAPATFLTVLLEMLGLGLYLERSPDSHSGWMDAYNPSAQEVRAGGTRSSESLLTI